MSDPLFTSYEERLKLAEERIQKLEELIVAQRVINIDTSQWSNCEPWELGGC